MNLPPPSFTYTSQSSQISHSQHPRIQPLLKRTSKKILIEESANLQKHLISHSKTSKAISNIPEVTHISSTQRIRDFIKIAKAQDSLSKFSYIVAKNLSFQQGFLRKNLKNFASLSSLDLQIHQNTAVKMLFKSLSSLKNLTHFTIRFKLFSFRDPKIIPLLFKKLKFLKKLTSITISLSSYSTSRGPELEIFSSNLTLLTQLRSLNLIFDRTIQFDDKSLVQLASDLEKLTQLSQIQIDFGEWKKIQGTTLLRIFTSFRTIKTLSDISIELRFCQILSDDDREYLSQSLLCLDPPSIRKLALHFHQNPMKDSLVKISKALKKFFSLETLCLNFSGCSIIRNEGVAELSSSLKEMISLSSLSLVFPSSVNAKFLVRDVASALKTLNKLVYLELDLQRKEKTTADQVDLLFKNLEMLVCLRFLDLNLGYLKCLSDYAMDILGKSLKELRLLQNLTLSFACTSMITSQGVAAVSSSIKGLKKFSLLDLCLACNDSIDEKAINAIAGALEGPPDLYSVSLSLNDCEKLMKKEDSLASLFKVMRDKENIRDVHLCLTLNEANSEGINDLEKRKNLSYYWL